MIKRVVKRTVLAVAVLGTLLYGSTYNIEVMVNIALFVSWLMVLLMFVLGLAIPAVGDEKQLKAQLAGANEKTPKWFRFGLITVYVLVYAGLGYLILATLCLVAWALLAFNVYILEQQ